MQPCTILKSYEKNPFFLKKAKMIFFLSDTWLNFENLPVFSFKNFFTGMCLQFTVLFTIPYSMLVNGTVRKKKWQKKL